MDREQEQAMGGRIEEARMRRVEEKRGQGEEDGRKGQERKVGRGSLSAFDVKSLRQKHSGAECCSTCAGNPQCQLQLGDDEGREIKRSTEQIKTKKKSPRRKHAPGRVSSNVRDRYSNRTATYTSLSGLSIKDD